MLRLAALGLRVLQFQQELGALNPLRGFRVRRGELEHFVQVDEARIDVAREDLRLAA